MTAPESQVPLASTRGALSGLRSVQPRYLYQEMALEMVRYIREQKLPVGHVLPGERELCSQLGVSRPSLREALRMLELFGVVQRQRGGPLRVGNFDFDVLTQWIPRSFALSQQTILELLPVRQILEVHAAELAAEHISQEQLGVIESILQTTKAKIDVGASESHLLEDDLAFHEAVFAAANNSILLQLVRVVAGLLRELRMTVLRNEGSKLNMLAEHGAIYEALVAGDPEAAASAAREHITGVNRLVMKILVEDPSAWSMSSLA